MRGKIVVAVLSLFLVALSLAAFGGALAPDPPAQKGASAPQKSLAAARVFMLLPEGKVEISDSWARRVFKWDGKRWVEVEVKRLETPQADSR
jgi:hypothetical protein